MYELIKKLCVEKGISPTKLCTEITGSKGNLPTWQKGNINPTSLTKIADYFDVSVDYLLGREEKPDPMEQLAKLSSIEITEQVILEKYLELPKASRELVIAFMKSAIAEAEARAKQTEQATDTPIKQKSTYTCGELEDIRKAEQVAEQDAG